MPEARNIKVFVPSKNFEESLTYYLALGWKQIWKDDSLAELELGHSRFYLQNYYQNGQLFGPRS